MKKVLIPTLLASVLFAGEQNYIEIGAGFVKTKDNFSTQSKSNISSLSSAKSENETFPYIEMYYGYDISDSVKLYIASGEKAFNLGSVIDSSIGTFDLGVKLDASEQWENPFLTSSDRKKTDVMELGLYVGYGVSFSQNHDGAIRYEISSVTYDKESVSKDLEREATRHILSFENIFTLDENISYIANFSYELYDANGKSSSYDTFGFETGVVTKFDEGTSLAVLANVGKKDFDKFNSQVNKKIDSNIYGVKAVLNCEDLLPFENTYVSLKTGYEKEDANHNFYDKENTFGIVSVGYRF